MAAVAVTSAVASAGFNVWFAVQPTWIGWRTLELVLVVGYAVGVLLVIIGRRLGPGILVVISVTNLLFVLLLISLRPLIVVKGFILVLVVLNVATIMSAVRLLGNRKMAAYGVTPVPRTPEHWTG